MREYNGGLRIQTADGGKIPITAIGDIPSSIPLNNVYLCLSVTSNLFSIGQLVENGCKIAFSSSDRVMQDQMTWKEILRGPKWGCLFPLDLSAFIRTKITNDSLCFSAKDICHLWHNKLAHPNLRTMSTLFNSGLLNKSGGSSKCVSFDFDMCKMGKSKTLSSICFELVHSDVREIAPYQLSLM